MIALTETLIIPNIAKTKTNRYVSLYIVLKKIKINTLSHRTQFDIALENHALHAQPTAYE